MMRLCAVLFAVTATCTMPAAFALADVAAASGAVLLAQAGEMQEPVSGKDDAPGHAPAMKEDGGYVAPAVQTDLSALPFPVRRMRELLMEAARSGEIEKLRPYVGSGDDVTLFSFGGVDGDPIDFLRSISGDEEGHEILAILLEVLEAGFVRLEPGNENEMFVWPYFFAVPLEELAPPQRVELFKLLTYGDYQEMVSFGAYFFYRIGITPQGRWRFFVAGD